MYTALDNELWGWPEFLIQAPLSRISVIQTKQS
jgi:hypothetical protein